MSRGFGEHQSSSRPNKNAAPIDLLPSNSSRFARAPATQPHRPGQFRASVFRPSATLKGETRKFSAAAQGISSSGSSFRERYFSSQKAVDEIQDSEIGFLGSSAHKLQQTQAPSTPKTTDFDDPNDLSALEYLKALRGVKPSESSLEHISSSSPSSLELPLYAPNHTVNKRRRLAPDDPPNVKTLTRNETPFAWLRTRPRPDQAKIQDEIEESPLLLSSPTRGAPDEIKVVRRDGAECGPTPRLSAASRGENISTDSPFGPSPQQQSRRLRFIHPPPPDPNLKSRTLNTPFVLTFSPKKRRGKKKKGPTYLDDGAATRVRGKVMAMNPEFAFRSWSRGDADKLERDVISVRAMLGKRLPQDRAIFVLDDGGVKWALMLSAMEEELGEKGVWAGCRVRIGKSWTVGPRDGLNMGIEEEKAKIGERNKDDQGRGWKVGILWKVLK